MPSIAHLARILSLLIVLRGALAGPIIVRDTPCAEDAAKNAISSSTSKLGANNLIANNGGVQKAADTTKGASIADFFGFDPASANGNAKEETKNADGSVAVGSNGGKSSSSNNNANRITVVDPTDKKKEVAQGATNTVDSLRSSGDKKLSSAGDNGKGTQSSSTDNRNPIAVKVDGSASPATADGRTPADSSNAALSQTGKASKDNKEANESVGLNKGESSFRPLTGDNNKIGAKADANANRFGTEGSGSKVGTQGNTVGVTAQKPGEQSSEKGAAASGSISGNRTPGNDFPPSAGDASRLLSSTNPPNTSSDHIAADTTIPLASADHAKGAADAQGKAKGAQGSIGNQQGAAAPKLGEQAKSDTKVAEGSVDSAAGHPFMKHTAVPGVSVLNGNTNVGNIEGLQSNVVGDNNSGKQAGKANGGKKGDDC
ncbi:hypothetical protein B0H14DRAFT_1265256 [Mycena olivaceomarginata]|nr:hypothetical protein B0H14DRAFT_1265256 [Mycena olivaceomarginata]